MLEAILNLLKTGKERDRKLLVVKDAERYLETREAVREPESDKIISMLKEIARKIRGEESDATVIIVSSVVHIPKSLEKLITVLELELPDEKEIEDIIDRFVKDYDIPTVYYRFAGICQMRLKDYPNLKSRICSVWQYPRMENCPQSPSAYIRPEVSDDLEGRHAGNDSVEREY